MGGGHDFDLLSDIVEDQHRIGEQKGEVRQIKGVLLPGSQVLERAYHVVTQISDGAADERGEVRHSHRAIAFHHLPQTLERVPTARNALLAGALNDKKVAPIFVHNNGRTTAEEGIACPFFTALNGLQEVSRGAMIYFGKGRNGGIIVRENLSIERNEIALSGILPKLVETE